MKQGSSDCPLTLSSHPGSYWLSVEVSVDETLNPHAVRGCVRKGRLEIFSNEAALCNNIHKKEGYVWW